MSDSLEDILKLARDESLEDVMKDIAPHEWAKDEPTTATHCWSCGVRYDDQPGDGCTRETMHSWPDTLAREAEGHVRANDRQVGGDHYKRTPVEPWDVIGAWELDYFLGNALKYISRADVCNGSADLRKAIHYLQKAIEMRGTESD
jgi:hypothetical protein